MKDTSCSELRKEEGGSDCCAYFCCSLLFFPDPAKKKKKVLGSICSRVPPQLLSVPCCRFPKQLPRLASQTCKCPERFIHTHTQVQVTLSK